MNTNEIKAEEKKVEEQVTAQVENKKSWWKKPVKIGIAVVATAAAVALGMWGAKKIKAKKAAAAVKESVTAEETASTEATVEEKEVRRERNNGWTERNRERNSGWSK